MKIKEISSTFRGVFFLFTKAIELKEIYSAEKVFVKYEISGGGKERACVHIDWGRLRNKVHPTHLIKNN